MSSSAEALPDLVRRLDHAGIDILGLEVRRPTLDDAFVNLVGRPPSGNGTEAVASHPAKSILAHLPGGHR